MWLVLASWQMPIWSWAGSTKAAPSGTPVMTRWPGSCRGVGNQGGFRALGRHSQDAVRLVVLYTSGAEPDWPDALDPYTGAFTYFGDNRSPGRTLHETPRKGNLLLDTVFTRAAKAASGSPRSCCSTSPAPAVTSGSAACSRPARTGSAAKRTWRPCGAPRGDTVPELPGPVHRPERPVGITRLDQRARRRPGHRRALPGALAHLGGSRPLHAAARAAHGHHPLPGGPAPAGRVQAAAVPGLRALQGAAV